MASEPGTISVITNPKYKPDGLQAYLSCLIKYQFNPTKPGPFTTSTKTVHSGKFGTVKSGGRQKAEKKLLFKDKHGHIGEVPAQIIQNDLQYLCPVTIGTPGKVYHLNFDTGSSDLWLWSTELPSTTNTAGRHLFNRELSSTFKLSSGSSWGLSYNDKSFASGIVGTDTVTIGGLKVIDQSVELANNLSDSFQKNYGDGLLGLGFGTINRVMPVPVPTWAENLIAQKNAPTSRQLFTAYLTSYRDAKSPFGKSFYSFGHIVKRALAGQQINYVYSDNSQGLWQIPSTTATIGDRPISRFDNTAVADTGTSLALLEDVFVDYLYSLIPGAYYDSNASGYVYPSNTTDDQIPTIKIAVGDIEYEIHKVDMAFAEVGDGFTYGGIQSRGDLSFDVLGDTFLKSVYAIFDIGNSQFGVVPKVLPSNSSATHRRHAHPYPKSSGHRSSESSAVGPPNLAQRHASSPDNPRPLARRESSSTSAATSLLPGGFSSLDRSTTTYGTLLLLTYYLSARGNLRFLIAGFVCLVLLQ